MTDGYQDGGPAFPLNAKSAHGQHRFTHTGMTLRDWFASQADVPWNAVLDTLRLRGEPTPTAARFAEYRAELRYLEADAMLAERAKGGA